jgi:cellulose synthase/poly-beta-1,6-N-acetylglucosamine synthase-like glycosyltransferase
MAERLTVGVGRRPATSRRAVRVLFANMVAAAVFLSAARLGLICALVVLDARRPPRAAAIARPAPVCVLVPAYNEAEVIGRTLDSLLASDHPDFTVLVIDDGSDDGTAEAVLAAARADGRVRLLRQPNAGKAAALNRGLSAATADIVVTLDGDTLVEPQTLSALAAPFAEGPAVTAVCGNVVAGRARSSLLAHMQDAEYLASQNFDRRALASINCVGVVPGATGAWRKQAVLAAGGCSTQTLTEDADLTLTILARGGRIVYAVEARGITETPATSPDLLRQRFRWTYGMLQCLWKHRAQLGRGRFGCVTLPDLFLFQIALPILAPVGHGFLVLCLCRGEFGAVTAAYTTLFMAKLVASVIAYRLDGRRLVGLWARLAQQLAFCPFACAIALRALTEAVAGRRHGWVKVARTGVALAPAVAPRRPTNSRR